MSSDIKELLTNKKQTNKVIFHIDVNSAYLSWTAVDLLKHSKKDIREVPSIIGGDETRRSGVVLARSNPAKKLGVKTGEPIYFALKKVPTLEIYPPNFSVYESFSKAFNVILEKYTAVIEKTSIDESFLDVTDYLFGKTPLELAETIKKDIFVSLGFTVNIGVSDIKLLAKTASDFKKPNMIHTLYSYEVEKKLWPLDISSLFTVGKKTQNILRKLQINTIKDIANSNPKTLEQKLGKHGIKIWKLANGVDEDIVNTISNLPKSISHAETLSTNLKDTDLIKNHIIKIVEEVASNLRKEKLNCKTIRLTLRDTSFKEISKQKTLSENTDSTKIIYNTAIELFETIFNNNEIRLISVCLDSISPNINEQLDLFTYEKENRSDRLSVLKRNSQNIKEDKIDNVLDTINEKYNSNIITRARNIDNSINKKKKE